MIPLEPANARSYWEVYTAGRNDLLASDPAGYTEMYLSLDPEAQGQYFVFMEGRRIVGCVRPGYDSLVEKPYAINNFSMAPDAREWTRQAIVLATEALISRGADEIVASFDESYLREFADLGFTEWFSRGLMEAPLWERGNSAVPLENPRLGDVEEMASFLMSVYEGHLEQDFGMHVGTPEDWLDYVRAIWEHCLPSQSWLLRDERGIVGLCLVGLQAGHPFVIEEGVREDRRREGLGRVLLLKAMNSLVAGGYRSLWLEVTIGNDPAIRLYESLGFKITRNRTTWAVAKASDFQG